MDMQPEHPVGPGPPEGPAPGSLSGSPTALVVIHMKRDITLMAFALHVGQSADSPDIEIGRISSNLFLHLLQTYSYIGISLLHIQFNSLENMSQGRVVHP